MADDEVFGDFEICEVLIADAPVCVEKLEDPVFLCCDNCKRWDYVDPLDNDPGWVNESTADFDDGLTDQNLVYHDVHRGNHISLQSNLLALRVRKEEPPIPVSDPHEGLNVSEIHIRPSYGWKKKYCLLTYGERDTSKEAWEQKLVVCKTCRLYITGRHSEEDDFNDNEQERTWLRKNVEHKAFKSSEEGKAQDKRLSTFNYFWPAYMWVLMTNNNVLRFQYFEMWKLMPTLLRNWWVESLVRRRGWKHCPGGISKMVRSITESSNRLCFVRAREPNFFLTDEAFNDRMPSLTKIYVEGESRDYFDHDPRLIDARFSFDEHCPYSTCSFDYPTPYFVCGNYEYVHNLFWKHKNDAKSVSFFLNEVMSHCAVKCPYGCNEFIFDAGTVDYYSILHEFLDAIVSNGCTMVRNLNLLSFQLLLLFLTRKSLSASNHRTRKNEYYSWCEERLFETRRASLFLPE